MGYFGTCLWANDLRRPCVCDFSFSPLMVRCANVDGTSRFKREESENAPQRLAASTNTNATQNHIILIGYADDGIKEETLNQSWAVFDREKKKKRVV